MGDFTDMSAAAINNLGHMVGNSIFGGPWFYDGLSAYPIFSVLDAASAAQWNVTTLRALNDSDMLTGSAVSNVDGRSYAVLLARRN